MFCRAFYGVCKKIGITCFPGSSLDSQRENMYVSLYKAKKMADRPSHNELSGKLKAAGEAVKNNRIAVVKGMEKALVTDALDLGYDIRTELRTVLSDLIARTKPENYAGGRPPKKSYKGEITGQELFAFKIRINRFDRDIYYKFTIWNNDLWLTSLHEDR